MRFNYRQVEIFWAVMTTGSVTRAAVLLNSSQPTVSRELARFEQLLELKLFERSHARLQPTAQALSLFEEVRNSYHGLQRIHQAAQSIRQGHPSLSIVCLPALSQSLLPLACAELLSRCPEVNVQIVPQESPLLEEWMTAQRHDFGLSENAETPSGTHGQSIFTADEVCVMPAAHPLSRLAVVGPEDLEGLHMVSLAGQDPYRLMLERILGEAGVQRRNVIETHSAAAVCAFVQQGIGVAIVNPLTALSFAGPGLCMRRFARSIPFRVNLITAHHRPRTPAGEAFIEAVQGSAQALRLRLEQLLRL